MLQREARKAADKTMGDLANFLGVSVSYVSDVERGYRQPWTNDRILQIAKFLGTNPIPLLEAAATVRGSFELDANVSQVGREVGASLTRAWSALTDEDFRALEEIAQKRMKNGGGEA